MVKEGLTSEGRPFVYSGYGRVVRRLRDIAIISSLAWPLVSCAGTMDQWGNPNAVPSQPYSDPSYKDPSEFFPRYECGYYDPDTNTTRYGEKDVTRVGQCTDINDNEVPILIPYRP